MFDSITHREKRAFLEAYLECGSIRYCAQLAGIHRSTHYEWLKTDPDYAEAFQTAHQRSADSLLDECVQRAQLGVEEYVVSGGQVVSWRDEETGVFKALKKRKYSDGLLAMLIKARMPEYRDSSSVKTEHSGGIKLEHKNEVDIDLCALTDEEFASLRRLSEKAAAARDAGRSGGEAQAQQAGQDVPSDGTSEA